jgi:NAD-dependent deacetylase
MATQGGLRGHMVAVEPNAGHRALARLEELGLFRGVITQNIDGLHFAAGSRDVLELHGTSKRVACLSCKASWPSEEIIQRVRAGEDDPSCTECGGILKSATISFGQQLDPDVINEAERWAIESDVCLVVGSTLVVYPAAMIPEAAKASGAALVIVNREPTPLDGIADEVVLGEAGPTLTDLVGRVERLIS